MNPDPDDDANTLHEVDEKVGIPQMAEQKSRLAHPEVIQRPNASGIVRTPGCKSGHDGTDSPGAAEEAEGAHTLARAPAIAVAFAGTRAIYLNPELLRTGEEDVILKMLGAAALRPARPPAGEGVTR